jgi:hypothetical protein
MKALQVLTFFFNLHNKKYHFEKKGGEMMQQKPAHKL